MYKLPCLRSVKFCSRSGKGQGKVREFFSFCVTTVFTLFGWIITLLLLLLLLLMLLLLLFFTIIIIIINIIIIVIIIHFSMSCTNHVYISLRFLNKEPTSDS